MNKVLCIQCNAILMTNQNYHVECSSCQNRLRFQKGLFSGHFLGIPSNHGSFHIYSAYIFDVIREKFAINAAWNVFILRLRHLRFRSVVGVFLFTFALIFLTSTFIFSRKTAEGVGFGAMEHAVSETPQYAFQAKTADLIQITPDTDEFVYYYFERDIPVKNQQSANEEIFHYPFTARISSGFGYRYHPVTHQYSSHHGIDLAVPMYSKIKAVFSGKVIYSGFHPGYGNVVVVRHNRGFETLYAHCSKNLVRSGAIVKQGQEIALVGKTGMVTAAHLHFELRRNGQYLNPNKYLNRKLGLF